MRRIYDGHPIPFRDAIKELIKVINSSSLSMFSSRCAETTKYPFHKGLGGIGHRWYLSSPYDSAAPRASASGHKYRFTVNTLGKKIAARMLRIWQIDVGNMSTIYG